MLGVPSAFLRGIMWSTSIPIQPGTPHAQQQFPFARMAALVAGVKDCLEVISLFPCFDDHLSHGVENNASGKTRFSFTKT
jgi:hypothetical protein